MLNLKNKKILVLGATGTLGKSTAIKLSQLGAKVVISGRDKTKLDDVLSKLTGDGHYAIQFDLSNLDKIYELINLSVSFDNEKLTGLVYCAGTMPIRPIKNTKSDFLHQTMVINYYAFVEMVRLYSDKRVSDGGSIVAISSYSSINGDKGQLAYAASKSAIDSSVIVMSKELYSKNIRVNAIRPAIIKGETTNIEILPTSIKNIIEKMKTGLIDPNIIAEQIAFLISDCSSGVYGRCFDVKGYLS